MNIDSKVFFDRVRKSVFKGKGMAQSAVDTMNALLDEAAERGIKDTRMIGYVLATTRWEVGAPMKPIREKGSRAYFNKYEAGTRLGRDLGNTQKGDGYRYRGGGDVQITGRRNYRVMGEILGLPLEDRPELVLRPDIAAQIIWEGMTSGKSLKGDFTKWKLEDFFTSSKTDWENARKIVNPKDYKSYKPIAEWARQFHYAIEAATKAFKSPEALTDSRTVKGAGAAAAGGAVVLGDQIEKAADAVEKAHGFLGWHTLGILLGVLILAGAAWALYARWDDAGRPRPRQIFDRWFADKPKPKAKRKKARA